MYNIHRVNKRKTGAGRLAGRGEQGEDVKGTLSAKKLGDGEKKRDGAGDHEREEMGRRQIQ